MTAYSQSVDQELVFYGIDGIEAEEFIRSVRKAAKAAGRMRDSSWILDEVYAAFAGHALRWYIELDDETRSDWLLLQRAIMQEYPPPSQRSLRDSSNPATTESITVAMPAAAVPRPSFPLSSPVKCFYIRAVQRYWDALRYVGIIHGNLVLVSSRSEGVVVRHDCVTKELCVIEMPSLHCSGVKIEIRRSDTLRYKLDWGGSIRLALLQLLDPEGLPKGPDPIQWGESFTSWDVKGEDVRPVIPQDIGSSYQGVELFLAPFEDNLFGQYPLIRACINEKLCSGSEKPLRPISLKLEEVQHPGRSL